MPLTPEQFVREKIDAQLVACYETYLIGLTATPSKQTIGFFNQNLVTEYTHERAVADGVNVGYDVYRIRTEVTDRGSRVEKAKRSTNALKPQICVQIRQAF